MSLCVNASSSSAHSRGGFFSAPSGRHREPTAARPAERNVLKEVVERCACGAHWLESGRAAGTGPAAAAAARRRPVLRSACDVCLPLSPPVCSSHLVAHRCGHCGPQRRASEPCRTRWEHARWCRCRCSVWQACARGRPHAPPRPRPAVPQKTGRTSAPPPASSWGGRRRRLAQRQRSSLMA